MYRKKIVCQRLKSRECGQRAIAANIAEKSSLTPGDIANVIENLLQEMPKVFTEGKSVKLGEFGSFRISISSEGVAKAEDFNTNFIRKGKIIFTPGKALKEALEHLHYEKA